MRGAVPSILLGLLSGTCDTAGFLALNKLFTSHVTGNLVLAGAAWASPGQHEGIVGRLVAIPVFVGVVWLGRLSAGALRRHGLPVLRTFLVAMTALLAAFLALGVTLGPFRSEDTAAAVGTGMAGVAAMALLSIVARLWPGIAAGNTAMTGNSIGLMADLAELALGQRQDEPHLARDSARLAGTLVAFVAGCALSAVVYVAAGDWCMGVPLPFALWMTALWPRDADR